MNIEQTPINCPQCGNMIDVNEIVYKQLYAKLSDQFAKQFKNDKEELEIRAESLEKERAVLVKNKAELDEAISAGIQKRILSEKIKIEKQIRDRVIEEKAEELKSYREQLDEKVKEVKDLNRLKADFQRLEREKNELKEKIEAEAEERINLVLDQERSKIRKSEEEKNELKIAEKEHVIHQLRVQLTAASKKAEQSSGQLRGEVMETSLEDYLRHSFPTDEIEEIKKGVKGADSLHHVKNTYQENCGAVYYETKRTKEFQGSWISKFKTDMRERNADIGVIVTEEYPKGIERMTMVDGIWVCSFSEAKGLCFVLRETLIMLQSSKTAQNNKAGKMEILYEYMVSNEFRMQIEAIVEGFSSMHENLNKERRAMEALWKQRQKELEKVILNTTHIYSTIRGIAGNAVKPIAQLELDNQENALFEFNKSVVVKKSGK
jgi:hypothetical protein